MPARLVVQEGNVSIFDLLGSGDQTRIDAMLELYGRLFPQYQHYVPRMRRRAEFSSEHRPGHVVHYWLIEVDGIPAGLRTFRYIRHRHCGLAHALTIAPEFREVAVRDKRLAVFVIYECLTQIIQDAIKYSDQPPLGMVNEVEPDRLMEHYTKNGLVQLPVKYVEPIFPLPMEGRSRSEELSLIRFSPMHMGFLPNPELGAQKYSKTIIKDFVLAFLVDHYGLPSDHPVVIDTINSIQGE